LDWTFGMRCIDHIGHSGCKWGISAVTSDQLNTDAHVVIASLRNSSGALYSYIEEFVDTRVFYDHGERRILDRQLFWILLGVTKPDMLAAIMEVNPWWNSSQQILSVAGQLQLDPDGVTKIISVLQYCLQWINWSDTRWTKMGSCSRLYLRSKAVGIDYLVRLVSLGKHSSNDQYHIGGYERFDSFEVQRLLAIAAVSNYPMENFVLELLKDDRFMLRAAYLRGVLDRETQLVANLPNCCWDFLAELVTADADFGGWELRHCTMRSMMVSLSYVEEQGYSQLNRLPLSLTQGDITNNLERLRTSDVNVLDAQSRKIQICFRIDPARTRDAVTLLQHAAGSTGLSEKGHAPASILKKLHNHLEPKSLKLRSFVHLHAPLFKIGEADACLQRLRGQWETMLHGMQALLS
jgi:hypothetical protein